MSVAPFKTNGRDLLWLGLLSINFGVFFVARNMMGYAVPFASAALRLNVLHIGWLASGLAASWALGSVIGGAASRRWPVGWLLVIITGISGLLTIAAGFASSLAVLFALRLLLGLVLGPAMPFTQSMVAGFAPPGRRGMYMGSIQSLGAAMIGAVVGPLLLVPLFTAGGWSAGFVSAGVMGLIMMPVMALGLRWRGDASPKRGLCAKSRLRPSRNLICAGLASVAVVGLVVTDASFVPLFLVRIKHIAPAHLGPFAGALGAGGGISAFLGPALSDRLGRRPVCTLFALLGATGLLTLTLPWVQGGIVLAAVLTLSGFAGGVLPLAMAIIPAESVPEDLRPVAVGLVQGMAEIAGGVGAPLLAGWLALSWGLSAAVLVSASFAVLAALAALPVQETAPHRR